MEDHYKTLQVIYDIIKEEPNPETYKCRPREIILRQYLTWPAIEQNLKQLEEEGMVSIKQEDTLLISITTRGIEKIKNKRKYIPRT
jgi:DNA-binding MarR family transcriptional regulator